MLGSLRSKLIAAFAFVIFLSLFLAGSAFVFLLRDYQVKLAMNQMADLALPLSYQVGMLEHAGAHPAQISYFLEEQAAEMKLRVLLVGRDGRIVEDTAKALYGQQVHLQPATFISGLRVSYWGYHVQEDGQRLLLVASGTRPVRMLGDYVGVRAFIPSYSVVLAVPEANVSAGWWRLAPMLSFAAAIALLVSTVVAYFLARSISRPIAQVTLASEQIARGNYDQHIEAQGRDEVGQLADAFNRMSRQVALSHRTLREFLANVSHELRTPLTSIQGFSQAMVDGALRRPEDYTEAGRIISEEAERMRRLVDDLMSLSRLESGQVQMDRSKLDMADLLGAAVRRVQRQAAERQVHLELKLADLPSVEGDNHWLEQVFANLLDNALRHTPTGGTISVEASPVTLDNGLPGNKAANSRPGLCVRVHNTGSLIPPEDLPHVFERFYQVDKSRTSGNSGLGLAIVREIAQAHGGSVEAMSQPEYGTSFLVKLPATIAA